MDWSRVWEHFTIVAIASVFTILLGLLLGFTAHLNKRAGKVILAVVLALGIAGLIYSVITFGNIHI